MIHLPVLRFGTPYSSLDRNTLRHVATGEKVAEVSVANPGLVARDLNRIAKARKALDRLSIAELIQIARKAGQLFGEAELPLGHDTQGPEDYVNQLSATTGLPQSLVRANMAKSRYVMEEMETVLGGLTRGLDLSILDQGFGNQDGRPISYRRETDVLGAILPSNSPGVHSLWIPAVAMKVALALKPGRQEPWTPYRIAQAFLAAGCPPEAFSFYPTSYAGAHEILLRTGRSLLFGDKGTVDPWRGDEGVQIHGPGWSKVFLGSDMAPNWEEHLELMATSVAANGGRSCINASGVWTAAHGRDLADGLAKKLASIEARALDDPKAQLAAFPSREAAQALSDYIDAQLETPGAEDMTARYRDGRVGEAGGSAFVLPTVIYCEDPGHSLASAEFLFPFVSVVEAAEEVITEKMGPTLVATGLTENPEFAAALLDSTNIERLNLGPIPTSKVSWDQPHEGNLFQHLYRQRAFQRMAATGAGG